MEPDTVPGTITLTGSWLTITDPAGVDIQGPGAGLLTIAANGMTSACSVTGVAEISGLTITHCHGDERQSGCPS